MSANTLPFALGKGTIVKVRYNSTSRAENQVVDMELRVVKPSVTMPDGRTGTELQEIAKTKRTLRMDLCDTSRFPKVIPMLYLEESSVEEFGAIVSSETLCAQLACCTVSPGGYYELTDGRLLYAEKVHPPAIATADATATVAQPTGGFSVSGSLVLRYTQLEEQGYGYLLNPAAGGSPLEVQCLRTDINLEVPVSAISRELLACPWPFFTTGAFDVFVEFKAFLATHSGQTRYVGHVCQDAGKFLVYLKSRLGRSPGALNRAKTGVQDALKQLRQTVWAPRSSVVLEKGAVVDLNFVDAVLSLPESVLQNFSFGMLKHPSWSKRQYSLAAEVPLSVIEGTWGDGAFSFQKGSDVREFKDTGVSAPATNAQTVVLVLQHHNNAKKIRLHFAHFQQRSVGEEQPNKVPSRGQLPQFDGVKLPGVTNGQHQTPIRTNVKRRRFASDVHGVDSPAAAAGVPAGDGAIAAAVAGVDQRHARDARAARRATVVARTPLPAGASGLMASVAEEVGAVGALGDHSPDQENAGYTPAVVKRALPMSPVSGIVLGPPLHTTTTLFDTVCASPDDVGQDNTAAGFTFGSVFR